MKGSTTSHMDAVEPFLTMALYYKAQSTKIKRNASTDTILAFHVSIWSECRDLNPRPLEPEPSAIPNFATPRYANLLYEIPGKKSTRKTQFFPHLRLHFRRPPCIGIEPAKKGGPDPWRGTGQGRSRRTSLRGRSGGCGSCSFAWPCSGRCFWAGGWTWGR